MTDFKVRGRSGKRYVFHMLDFTKMRDAGVFILLRYNRNGNVYRFIMSGHAENISIELAKPYARVVIRRKSPTHITLFNMSKADIRDTVWQDIAR